MCNGFAPLISKPTHFKGQSSTSIDQIWCNVISENVFSGILNISTSAHLPIFVSIPNSADSMSSSAEDSPNDILIHNICSKNIEKFERDLYKINNLSSELTSAFNTNRELPANECEAQFNDYYFQLKSIYKSNFLETVDMTNKRNFVNKPWISVGIAKSCKVKNILHRKWIRSRGKSNEENAESLYKSYRSKLRDIMKTSKTDHYRKRFENCKGDLKKSWKVLNEMRNKKRKISFPNYIEFNKQLIVDRRIIVNKFNEYFVNIAKNLNDSKSPAEFKSYRLFLKNRVNSTMFLSEIESSEIDLIIDKLNPNKSSDMSPRVLKLFRNALSPILTTLFNNCMSAGVFPDV